MADDQATVEQIALALKGGPADGQRRIIGVDSSGWPPSERVAFADTPGGYYRRTKYSQLPEGGPHIIRGAEYEWVDH